MERVDIRKYPNFYNLMLLMATGYKVEGVVEFGSNKTFSLILRKDDCTVFTSRNRERQTFIIDLFANSTSQGVADLTEQVITNVNYFLKGEKCQLNSANKEALQNLVLLQKDGVAQNVQNGAFVHSATKTFQRMAQNNQDFSYLENKSQGNTTLASALDKWVHESAELGRRYEFSQTEEYLLACVNYIMRGEDISPIVQSAAGESMTLKR